MRINIVCVGKLKPEYQRLFDIYGRKIAPYATLVVHELRERNNASVQVQVRQETELIKQCTATMSNIYLCALDGKHMTSEQFADYFTFNEITFVVGGSHGVELTTFPHRIAFSQMTLPHQLFRIVLVEQVFRALAIRGNSRYHK